MSSSERLKIFLKAIGKTQKEFAGEIGMTQGSISDIIRGKVNGLSETAIKLCGYLYDLNPTWLLTGQGEMFLSDKEVHQNASVCSTGQGKETLTPRPPLPEGEGEKKSAPILTAELMAIVNQIDGDNIHLTRWFQELERSKQYVVSAINTPNLADQEGWDNLARQLTKILKEKEPDVDYYQKGAAG